MMNKEELIELRGGIQTISATMINALVKVVTTAYELGRAIGSAFRRARTGRTC